MIIPEYSGELPWLTAEQMSEVHRAMLHDYGIGPEQVMENAGRCLADLVRRRCLGGDPRGGRITVLAGSGGNGACAMVAVRRLRSWGSHVSVSIPRPVEKLEGPAGRQAKTIQAMDAAIEVGAPDAPRADDLVVDGLIGYAPDGPPRGLMVELMEWANDQPAPVLSVDVPSGLDGTSGVPSTLTVRATGTIALGLPMAGLRRPEVREIVGEVYLGDISVPPALYRRRLNLRVEPVFAEGELFRLPLS